MTWWDRAVCALVSLACGIGLCEQGMLWSGLAYHTVCLWLVVAAVVRGYSGGAS